MKRDVFESPITLIYGITFWNVMQLCWGSKRTYIEVYISSDNCIVLWLQELIKHEKRCFWVPYHIDLRHNFLKRNAVMLRLASYFLFLAIFRYVLFPNFCKCCLITWNFQRTSTKLNPKKVCKTFKTSDTFSKSKYFGSLRRKTHLWSFFFAPFTL